MQKVCLMAVACLLLSVCGKGTKGLEQAEAKTKTAVAEAAKTPQTIDIYCYDDFPVDKAQFLRHELQKVYPSVVIVDRRLPLPKEHYYAPRQRYSGVGLLKDLKKYTKDKVVLGLTDEVIYQSNELSPTFGVFGISFVGARVSVISSTQPSGKKHPDNHLVELMMHELGHAFGLRHCQDEHCFMVDAEHGNKFSQTPSFCKECKAFLNKKGWKLK